jgi:hypothetical protein
MYLFPVTDRPRRKRDIHACQDKKFWHHLSGVFIEFGLKCAGSWLLIICLSMGQPFFPLSTHRRSQKTFSITKSTTDPYGAEQWLSDSLGVVLPARGFCLCPRFGEGSVFSSIGTLNIPGMNISRHNAFRICAGDSSTPQRRPQCSPRRRRCPCIPC